MTVNPGLSPGYKVRLFNWPKAALRLLVLAIAICLPAVGFAGVAAAAGDSTDIDSATDISTSTGDSGPGDGSLPRASIAANPHGPGFWTAFLDGGIRPVGGAPTFDDTEDRGSVIVPDPTGPGYWQVAITGEITEHGGAMKLCGGLLKNCYSKPGTVASAAATPDGKGLWVALMGTNYVIPIGSAVSYGDASNDKSYLRAIVPTPSGKGYYLLLADGGIYTKGDAKFYGSTGGKLGSNRKAVGMALHKDANGQVDGYWMALSDGQVDYYNGTNPASSTRVAIDESEYGGLSGIAPLPDSSGFAVVQDSTYPVPSEYPTRRIASCRGSDTDKDVACNTQFQFKFEIDNRTSKNLTITPSTSAESRPEMDGSGMLGADVQKVPGLKFGQAKQLAAGPSTDPAVVGLTVRTMPDRGARDAQMQLDVTPTNDSSDRQRIELTQHRDAISQWKPGTKRVQLLNGPQVASSGSGSIVAHLEETISREGDFAGTWTLVLEDAAPASSTTVKPTVTRLTQDWDANVGSDFAYLKRPVYRIDVPSVTKSYPDGVPGRIDIQPTTVQVHKRWGGPDGANYFGWEDLGTLTPVSTPEISTDGKSVTFGKTSFYFENKDGTSEAVKPAAGNKVVIEPVNTDRALDDVGMGSVLSMMRFNNDHQQWTVLNRSNNTFGLQRGGNCLEAGTDNLPRLVGCNDQPNQNWVFDDTGKAKATNSPENYQYRIRSVATGLVLTQLPDSPDLQLLPVGAAGAQTYRFTSADAVDPYVAVRLVGGWFGDTDFDTFPDKTAPTIDLSKQVLSGMALSKASNSGDIVNNGISSEELSVSLNRNGQSIPSDDPLFDYTYFMTGQGTKMTTLITGLNDIKPNSTALAVSTTRARHVNGLKTGTLAATGRSFWASTTLEQSTQNIAAVLAPNSQRFTSNLTTLSPVKEKASLDRSSILQTGVELTCGTYSSCAPADPQGQGALYRDSSKTLHLLTRYTAMNSFVAQNPVKPSDKLGTYQTPVRLSTNGYKIIGDTPADAPEGMLLDLAIVTPSGTMAEGQVRAR